MLTIPFRIASHTFVRIIEITNLNEEIQLLISTHQDEIGMLQHAILEKQAAINETESNLTVIGTYVDKLEERLATFAMARRDIELREQKCKEIEERAVQAERERDITKKKADELSVEHEELKKLLDELVKERTTYRNEKDALISERDKLREGEISLREALTSLEQDVVELDGVAQQWKSKVVQLELELEEEAVRAHSAREDYEELLAQTGSLKASTEASQKEEVDTPEPWEHKNDETSSPGESGPGAMNVTPPWLSKPKPAARQKTRPSDRQSVPLRSLRKFFSQRTGMHGVFTPSSRHLLGPPPRPPLPAAASTGASVRVSPPPELLSEEDANDEENEEQ